MTILGPSRCLGYHHCRVKSSLTRFARSSSHLPRILASSRFINLSTCSRQSGLLARRVHTRSMATATQQTNGESRDYGNFRLLKSFKIDYAPVKLSKWQSTKTGLTVVVGEHATPITNGHFTIASEIFDDTGRPHTLEHLIFLGSKSYPYKGVLDHLANRAGSNGTNAWTANDHTAYTISTAGTSGFLDMLPIYIDHILHPTITDAGFVTEVHHINGQGDDAGVVYSEMQARENQAGDLIALQSQRSLYPKSSAYRSETGGLMVMLRQLTAAQIRDYHSQYYVPHNLCLLIDGSIALPDLFKVLNEQVDPLILDNLPKSQPIPPPNWKRPFVETSTSQPLSITESRTQVVEFMEQDESIGEIYLNFLGPAPTDYRSNLAIKLLGNYLTDTPTSHLQKKFVEIKQPLCTGLGIYSEDRVNKNEITMYMQDVPAKYLEVLGSDVLRELQSIVKTNGIDMERMERVIRRDKRKLLNAMETGVSSVLSDAVIGDFLYGSADGTQLPSAFDDMADYNELSKWNAKQWATLLDKYFVSANCLTMVGRPSAKLASKIDEDEKSRIAKRKEELGEEKLEELQRKVDEAKAESEVPPPPSMIRDFPITDPSSLTWVPCETAMVNVPGQSIRGDQGDLQKRLDGETVDMAFQTHFSHVKSNFVSVALLFDTINLPTALRPYLALLSNSVFNVAVRRSDGTVLPFESVVDELSDFTVGQGASLTYRGDFSEMFVLSLKVEASDYPKAAQWLWDVISGSVFEAERLSVIAAKQLQELPYEKRNGNAIARGWANKLAFDLEKSTSEAVSTLSLFEFQPTLVKDLETNPDQVIKSLEALRKHLLDPSMFRVGVVGDVDKLDAPKGVLARVFRAIKTESLRAPSTARETLSALGLEPSNKLALIPMASIEGSYAVIYSKGPADWSHPDSAAIILAAATLNAAESYLWKYIRGSGLAYGCWVSSDRESGLVEFSVYRSPNAREAFEAAAKLLKGLADGTETLEQDIVDGARSTLTYDYASKASTVGAAGTAAYSNEVLKGLGKDADQEMLKRLPSVTLDDLRNVIAKYFLPLFEPKTAIGAVSINAGKADQVEQEFATLGFSVERKELPVFGGDDEGSDSLSSGEESADERSEDGMEGILSP